MIVLGVFMAVAVPSAASAANWTPLGSYTLGSAAIDLSIPALGMGSSCAASLDVDADGSSTLAVTGARFTDCVGTGAAANCDVSVTANNLDWAADDTVDISSVDYDLLFSGAACAVAGNAWHVAGTLAGGVFDNGSSSLTFSGASGLSATWGGVPLGGILLSGTLSQATGTLVST